MVTGLYDLQRLELVRSATDPRPLILPQFFAGQTVNFSFQAGQPTGDPTTPYTLVPITGVFLSLNYTVNNLPVCLANTNVFTPSTDGLTIQVSLTVSSVVTAPANQAVAAAFLAVDLSVSGSLPHIETLCTVANPSFVLTIPPSGGYPPANDPRLRMIYTPEMALGGGAGAAAAYSSSVDDTSFVQAAIAAASALTPPGVVRLNRQYRIATPNVLTVAVSNFIIDGVSPNVGFVLDFASGNGLTLAPATTPTVSANTGLRNCVLNNFSVTALQPLTGAAIFTNYTNNLRISGATVGTPTWTGRMNIYDGIVLQNAGNANLTDATQIYAHHYGITWSGTDLGFTTFDSYNYGGTLTGNVLLTGDQSVGSIGIAIIGGTGGIILDVGNLSLFENGVVVRQDVGYATNRELFATKNFTVDSNVYNGYMLVAGLMRFVGDVWSCGNGRSVGAPRAIPTGNGYAFSSQINYVSINLTGSYMYANGNDAVHITGATSVTIAGGDFFANGQNGSGSGAYIDSGVTNATVVGCNVTANASYGINIPGAGSITAVLAFNQTGANGSGTLAYAAGNQNIHAFGNTYGQSTNLCLTTDDTTPGTIAVWDSRHAILTGGGGNGAAAIGLSQTASTQTVNVNALQPGAAYWNLSMFAASYKFRTAVAGNPGLDIHNDGSLWRVGADGISTPVGAGVNSGSVPYAATITPVMGTAGADLVLDIATLTGNLTIANPIGTPANRQRLEIHLQQDSTGGRAVSYGTAYKFTAANPATSFPSAANNLYSILFEYWSRDSLWHAVGVAGPY